MLKKFLLLTLVCIAGSSHTIPPDESTAAQDLKPLFFCGRHEAPAVGNVEGHAEYLVRLLFRICIKIKIFKEALNYTPEMRILETEASPDYDYQSLAHYTAAGWEAYSDDEIIDLIDYLKEKYRNFCTHLGLPDTQCVDTWPPYVYTSSDEALATIEYRPDFGLRLSTPFEVFRPMLYSCDLASPIAPS